MKASGMSDRRDFLRATSAALAATSVPSLAAAGSDDKQKVFYSHGMVWNPELPGILGELRLTFDVAIRLEGTGLGTFGDEVHPESTRTSGSTPRRNRGTGTPSRARSRRLAIQP